MCNMCPDFFPACCSGGHHCSHNASILTCVCTRGCLESSLWVWECSTDHCWSSDTPQIHLQQSVNMSIQLPAGLQCDPIQKTEAVQQEHALVRVAWLYPRMNVANTVHLWKHHSYCCRVKTESAKTGLLRVSWSPMTVTNELLTLQHLSMHIIYPGANEHSLWGFFFSAEYLALCIHRVFCSLLMLCLFRNPIWTSTQKFWIHVNSNYPVAYYINQMFYYL